MKRGACFSAWQGNISNLPQGPVLGPFLFNLFMNDFFIEIQHSQVCILADNNTIYASGQFLDSVQSNLEGDMKAAIS